MLQKSRTVFMSEVQVLENDGSSQSGHGAGSLAMVEAAETVSVGVSFPLFYMNHCAVLSHV